MAITKLNGFIAPYRSLTFQQQAQAQSNGNGILSMNGAAAPDGLGNILIPPFTAVLQGLLVQSSATITVALPVAMPAPYFATVYSTSSSNDGVLNFGFAKTPADFTGTEAIIAIYDGAEWHQASLISAGGLLSDRKVDAVDTGIAGPKSGLSTSIVSANYVNAAGVLVDSSGLKVALAVSNSFAALAADPDWPRVDQIVYRRPADSAYRIGTRKLLTGGTYTTGTQKLYDTVLSSASYINKRVRCVVASDNTVHFIYTHGYGRAYTLLYQKYAANRVTNIIAETTIAVTITSINISVAIDSSDNLHIAYVSGTHIKWVKLSSSGAIVGGPTTIDAQSVQCDGPSISIDPFSGQMFIAFQAQISPPNYQLFLTVWTLAGVVQTSDVRITNTATSTVGASVTATDDLFAYIAYSDYTTGQIYYLVTNLVGQIITPAILVSHSTASQSFGTLVDQAQSPKIRVADNKQVFVFFLQNKGSATYGVAVYTNGSAVQRDITGSAENILDFSVAIDTVRNDLLMSVAQAARLDYAQLDLNCNVLQTVSLNVLGASTTNITKDKAGSLVHAWTLPLYPSYTNSGGNVSMTTGYIGPVSVSGSSHTLLLTGFQFSILSAGLSYIPNIDDEAIITGSSHGNNATKIVTAVSLQSINAPNDTYVITVSITFAAAESPATGDSVQFAVPNGNYVRFAKTVADLNQNWSLTTPNLPSDILLSRIALPSNIIFNYPPKDITVFTFTDNQVAAADVVGIFFDFNKYRSVVVHYDVFRKASAGGTECREVGRMFAIYSIEDGTWTLEFDVHQRKNDPGITWSVSSGQLQYTSSSIGAGTHNMDYKIERSFNV